MARGFDIPTAIDRGWGDIGITGLDAVRESQSDVMCLCNLGIRFSEVVVVSSALESINELKPGNTVITEYHKLAYEYFNARGISGLNFVRVTGAAEVYGKLSDISAIVTLKTSGKTLEDNNLKVLDTISKTQACLIANNNALKNKSELISKFVNSLKSPLPTL